MRSHKRERFLLYLWNVCNKCSHPSWRLDTYRPLHVFESHRTHTSYLGSQEERRGRADSHGGLETAGAGSDAKLRLRRAGGDGWTRSCLLASSPRREPELTSSPRASTNSLPSHLTSPQRGSGTCRVCDPFAVQNCSPQTLRLAPARLRYGRAHVKLYRSDHTGGSLEFGWGVLVLWGFGFFSESGI